MELWPPAMRLRLLVSNAFFVSSALTVPFSQNAFRRVVMIDQPFWVRTRPLQAEFSRFLADLALHKGHQGYHLTLVYKDAQTARAADRTLKHVFPKILSRVVSGNWIRAAEKGNLIGLGFLDTPGSRRSARRALVSVESTQDEYHHHCVLLIEPSKAKKIDRLVRLSFVEIGSDPPHSPFRRKMAQSSARVLRHLRGMLVGNDIMMGLPLRSLKIQRLPDQEDVERATDYAAKSLDRLSERFPDEAYSVLTKQRERPTRDVAL
jgi:hypothetical protein